ncbi:MAG: hypothetical protein ACQETE_04540 [Bacteroidota bacterium]
MKTNSPRPIHPWLDKDEWARWISDTFNPLFAPVYLVLILIWEQLQFNWTKLGASLIALLFFVAIPMGVLLWFQSRGHIQSLDLVTRRKRIRPYLLALLSYSVGIYGIYLLNLSNHAIVLSLLLCFLINSLVGFIITLGWKISIHTASLSTVVTFAWLMLYFRIIDSSNALFLIAVVGTMVLPALAWARMHLRVHTRAQIISGIIIAALLTIIETYWLLT